jgi:hypothetical protein
MKKMFLITIDFSVDAKIKEPVVVLSNVLRSNTASAFEATKLNKESLFVE